MKNRKLLIIDGSSMLSTNYYGNLPKSIVFAKTPGEKEKHFHEIMHTSDGTYTNAVFGMLRTILKIIKDQNPSNIVFCFDKSRNTFRRKEYADYKAQRSTTPQPLKLQFILMEQSLSDIGFKVLMHDDYEADDLAGSVVKKFETQIPTYLLTKDHDYTQLISEYTRVWMIQTKQEAADTLFEQFGVDKELANIPDKAFEMTILNIEEIEGVKAEQIPDLKGIVGDVSDNIPGIKGLAETSAVPLLKEYGSIEGIYEVIEDCAGDKKQLDELNLFYKNWLGIKRNPIGLLTKTGEDGELCGKAAAMLSKKLATIKTDIPLEFELTDMDCFYDKEKLQEYVEKLEFKSIKM